MTLPSQHTELLSDRSPDMVNPSPADRFGCRLAAQDAGGPSRGQVVEWRLVKSARLG